MKSKTTRPIFPTLLLVVLLAACTGNAGLSGTASNTPLVATLPIQTEPSLTALPNLTASLTATVTPTAMNPAERIPIIEYHNPSFKLSDEVMMTPEWFEAQMRWLSENGYATLSAAELVDFLKGGALPQKSVVLSFDIGVDRHTEYAQIVIPTLRKYGLKAIFFLVVNTNLVGDVCDQGERYCWSELRAWAEEGLISVESHGIYHKDYNTIDAATQRIWVAASMVL
jgi:hypothetical protein